MGWLSLFADLPKYPVASKLSLELPFVYTVVTVCPNSAVSHSPMYVLKFKLIAIIAGIFEFLTCFLLLCNVRWIPSFASLKKVITGSFNSLAFESNTLEYKVISINPLEICLLILISAGWSGLDFFKFSDI